MQQVELRPKTVGPTVRERETGSKAEKTKRLRGEEMGNDARPGQKSRGQKCVMSHCVVSCQRGV